MPAVVVTPVPVRLISAASPGLVPAVRLAAYLYLPPAAGAGAPASRAPGLVVGHGAGSRASRHAEFCRTACAAGFAVLALDFRGHGYSAGQGDGPLEEDVLAAVRYLRGHHAVDPAAICYRGSSMGAFYGIKAAPQAGFAALVLLCPAGEATMIAAIDTDESDPGRSGDQSTGEPSSGEPHSALVDTEAPDTEASGAQTPPGRGKAGSPATPSGESARWDRPRLRAYFEAQDSLRLAADVESPVLLIHQRGDRTVPLEHSLALAGSLSGDVTLLALEDGSHTTAQHDPALHTYSLAWLRDRVERAGCSS